MGYFDRLRKGPEILENIERLLKIDLRRPFMCMSDYYGIMFVTPIEEVIIDGKENINTREEKAKCLVKYALQYLNACYDKCVCGENLILRVDDKKSVKVYRHNLIEGRTGNKI